jgi:hypothetical protein
MSKKNEVVETVDAVEEVGQENNIQISIEQICAAIVNTLGSVEVPLENLIKDYQSQSISVNQDEKTKVLTFSLVDNAEIEVPTEAPAETE